MRAIQIHQFGGPEVLQLTETPIPVPDPGQVLVKVSSAGINFAETLMRENRYAMTPPLPSILGCEVAGTVAVAAHGWELDQRVAAPLFAVGQFFGGYADYVTLDTKYLVPIPAGLTDDAALALQVQGLSALALTRTTPVSGKTVLVNAAAGGVGSLLIQLLRHAGASKVIAAASALEKCALAISLGADHALDYSANNWLEQLNVITNGKGPDIIYESVGGQITRDSLQTLGTGGTLVIFGALNIHSFALGVPELLSMIFKNQSLRGFALVPLLTPDIVQNDLAVLFDLAVNGKLKVHIGGRYPLAEARQAHAAMSSRQTLGKLVLLT